jgi:hypothetical protein
VTCQTVIEKVKRHRRKVQRCTARLVSGTVKFTAATARDRTTISRGHVLYATGARVTIGHGRSQLLLNDRRALHAGRYTLTVRSRRYHHWITQRTTITIG